MKKIFVKLILRLEKTLGIGKDISSGIIKLNNPDRELENIIDICNILEEDVMEKNWINNIIQNRLAALIISVANEKSTERLLITKIPEELCRELNKKTIKEQKITRTDVGYKYSTKNIPLIIWNLKCGEKIRELIQLSSIVNSL